jgi:hypothetical protein
VLRVGNLEPGTIGFVRKRIGAEKDSIVVDRQIAYGLRYSIAMSAKYNVRVKVMIATLKRIAERYHDTDDNQDRPVIRDHITIEANRTVLGNRVLHTLKSRSSLTICSSALILSSSSICSDS